MQSKIDKFELRNIRFNDLAQQESDIKFFTFISCLPIQKKKKKKSFPIPEQRATSLTKTGKVRAANQIHWQKAHTPIIPHLKTSHQTETGTYLTRKRGGSPTEGENCSSGNRQKGFQIFAETAKDEWRTEWRWAEGELIHMSAPWCDWQKIENPRKV